MANQTSIKDQKIAVGDLVKVYTLLPEGGSRLHSFEGIVIAIKGRKENQSFTVRRIGIGKIGIERIWPVNSPWIKKVEVKRSGRVRRSKLYFLRERKGRAALKLELKAEKPSSVTLKGKKGAKKATRKTR